MIALLAFALAADPPATPDGAGITAPTTVGKAQLVEPIAELMSARTKQLVGLPGMALLEWEGLGAPVGTTVDVWTRSPKGICLAAPRVMVVLGPDAEGDAKHGSPVIRVPSADMARLRDLTYAAWTPRRPDDPRDYAELRCAAR
ncbi:MAG: hypothetical protein R3F61_31565 [Myxococcota bacterium]